MKIPTKKQLNELKHSKPPKTELKLKQIIGLEQPKHILKNYFKLFALKERKQRMIILEGKPGTCKSTLIKTMIAWAMKEYPNIFSYYPLDTTNVTGYVGTTEKIIKKLWEEIQMSKKKPIVFIDEADQILASRKNNTSKIWNERTSSIITQMDKNIPNLFIVAATNRPKMIDGAIFNRFGQRVYCNMPTKEELRKIIDVHLPFISRRKRNILHGHIWNYEKKWSGRDIKLLAENLIDTRDANRLENPDYKLTDEDILKECKFIINGKVHQQEDYLEQ